MSVGAPFVGIPVRNDTTVPAENENKKTFLEYK